MRVRLSDCRSAGLAMLAGFFVAPLGFGVESGAASNLVVEVEAIALPATARPGPSLLRDIPGLHLRDQGSGGPQSDLSILGGPFNTAGLLLNGLTLRNAQTEHWHADVPAPEIWFQPPALLTGLDRFRVAPGHPSGSIALDLAPLNESLRSITAGAGSKGALFGNLLATEARPLEGGGMAGASAFLSADRADQTDGQSDNHLIRSSAGGRISAMGEALQADLIGAHAWREFGARGFYGAPERFPSEEQVEDTLATLALTRRNDPLNPARLTAAWRRTEDTYWLDRRNRAFHRNAHVTDFGALHGSARQTLTDAFALDLRADGNIEALRSSNLGDHTRGHGSFALLPNLIVDPLTFTLGGSLDLFSDDKPAWLPAAGIEWAIADNHRMFVSYTESARQPSFTELNYNNPASLGNAGLKRQETRHAEIGWQGQVGWFDGRAVFFYEQGRNQVDWIRAAPGARWTSVNLREVETWGLAADSRLRLTAATRFDLDLLTVVKRCDTPYYASRYVMDYPAVAGGATLRQRLSRDLTVRLRQGIMRFVDNPTRRHDDWFFNASADLIWRLPRLTGFTLHLGAENLLDDNFQIFPGQRAAGQRFFSSLAYTW